MPASGAAPETPMTLVNTQLPVPLVGRLDQLAEQATARRPGIIREALTAYVNDRTAPVSRDEAEHD
ncbi:hypothetical protein [Micromonospora sp. HM5-17]|uniref:hypothetical protein n=1 Tax=Micromonospora sp. HM5-17 TaxID=2487710 RepID=UPI0011CD6518|nr:hypothetical protein [Micromonospora sp. HM5-17]